jgi:transcriptional regulator with XRE-family HTH domain
MTSHPYNFDPGTPLHVLLRRRREQLHLRQAFIAEAVRVTPECVGLWEAGARRISLDTIPRVAAVLQLPLYPVCMQALREYHPAFAAALLANATRQACATGL